MTGTYIVSVAGIITIPEPEPTITLTYGQLDTLLDEAYREGAEWGMRTFGGYTYK